MKKFKIYIFIFIGVQIILENQVFAQDPQFSQFYSTPLYLAPSFAGTGSKSTRIAMNYRNQWPQIPGGFNSYILSFDHYVPKIKSGFGILALRDQAGDGNLALTNIGGQYSFNIEINEDWNVRPGMHFLYTQRSIDFSQLTFHDQIDPADGTTQNASSAYASPVVNRKGDVDFAASAILFSRIFWLGSTFDHLLKPNQSLLGDKSPIPLKYTIFGGGKLVIKERLIVKNEESVSFTFLYKGQSEFKQLDAGAYYYRFPMMFGIWYRGLPVFKSYPGSDALVFMVGARIEDFSIGYSFDYTISQLRTFTSGAHEVAVVWNFKVKGWNKKKQAALPCPHF